MSRRLSKIQQIQKFQRAYTVLTSKLFDAVENDEPDDFKKMIMDYLMTQQALNSKFSMDLLRAIPKEVDKDRFDKIVKPLEKELDNEDNQTDKNAK